MDAAAELRRNPLSKHQIQPGHGDEQADARRDCRTRLARPNPQARARAGKYLFSLFAADHEQDWQPYPVDPYSCYIMCDHTCSTAAAAVDNKENWYRMLKNRNPTTITPLSVCTLLLGCASQTVVGNTAAWPTPETPKPKAREQNTQKCGGWGCYNYCRNISLLNRLPWSFRRRKICWVVLVHIFCC